MSDVVYAIDTVNVMMPDGRMVLIHKGDAHSPAEEIVRFKPVLFSDDRLQGSPDAFGADGLAVEQATANPGERRSVRRG